MDAIRIACTTTAALLLLLLGAGRTAAAPAIAVHAEGHTFAVGPSTFIGTASVTLDGEEFEAAVTTELLSMVTLPNGIILAETSHTFDFGDGDTFVTSDHARAVPTWTPGLYELYSSLKITDGTGIFEGANGHLHGESGTINFGIPQPEAIWSADGVIAGD